MMETGVTIAMEACGLTKSFELPSGRLEVLRGVDLAVAPRESLSIRGESGSGKSTLLNVLAGLERRDGGELRWRSETVAVHPGRRAALLRGRFIGMVFQSFYLVPEMSALENVLLAARITGRCGSVERERARELLDRLGLGGRLDQMPVKMSGGERQRVAVARALVNLPAVVLADEPTGNLDERTAEEVMRLLLEVVPNLGSALILVTHHPQYATWTDRQARLENGRIIAS